MNSEKTTGCAIGCLASAAIAAASIFGVFALICLSISGCASAYRDLGFMSPSSDSDGPADEAPVFIEKWSYGHGGEDAVKLVRIRLSGIIASERSAGGLLDFGSESGAPSALERIHAAEADPEVRGILIEIDSPGGEVTMSDILCDALVRFRESETNRVVVALVGDMACSGGYYVAAGADRIIVHPTSWVGSIGVIIPALDASALASKIGIASRPIVSGKNKNMLDPLVAPNPEHEAILQNAVAKAHERFVGIVADGRRLERAAAAHLADGRIFTAAEAVELKLADAIGYEEEAIAELAHLAGAKDGEYRVYRYEASRDIMKYLSSSAIFQSAGGLLRGIRAAAAEASVPRAEYRMCR